MKKEKGVDTYSYKGWLVSDVFLKRAFAVLGYYTVASLIVSFVLISILFLFMFLGMLSGFMMRPF